MASPSARLPLALALLLTPLALTACELGDEPAPGDPDGSFEEPPPTVAGFYHPFDTWLDPPAPLGGAHAYGSLVFESRREFFITGWVDDRCPADGRSAVLTIKSTGPYGTTSRRVHDSQACASEPIYFDDRIGSGGGIAEVTLALCLQDVSAGSKPTPCKTLRTWNNPNF